jgi:hypothetical protein
LKKKQKVEIWKTEINRVSMLARLTEFQLSATELGIIRRSRRWTQIWERKMFHLLARSVYSERSQPSILPVNLR